MANQEIILGAKKQLEIANNKIDLMKQRGWFFLAKLKGNESKYAKAISHYQSLKRTNKLIIEHLSK